jgi:transposase
MEEAMKEAATKKSRHKYDEAFKENALKMVENGQSVRSVAQGLGVAENLVHKWKKMRNLSRTSVDAEVAELRARLRQVEAERDVLKKALSIFSRQS